VNELISQARNQQEFNQITDQTISVVKHVKTDRPTSHPNKSLNWSFQHTTKQLT